MRIAPLEKNGTAIAAVTLALLFAGCSREFGLPPPPQPPPEVVAPVIQNIQPLYAFANTLISIDGSGFDPEPQNNLVHFPGGFVAPASQVEEGRIWVPLPPVVRDSGPITVSNRQATSRPSAQQLFSMGYGHPIYGSGVADLRFRHRPIGVVDTANVILIASTSFDAVVEDSGHFNWVGGRPVAFVRLPTGGGALLATNTAEGGRVLELNASNGHIIATSAAAQVVERFLLPLEAAAGAVACSIGEDPRGATWLSTWTRHPGNNLVAARTRLDVADVAGAAIYHGDVFLIASRVTSGHAVFSLFRIAAGTTGPLETVWPAEPAAVPSGPVTIVDSAGGTQAVVALDNGDLAVVPLAGGAWLRIVTISYAPAHALAAAPVAGHVLLTKSLDGALMQYDIASGEIDWSVQLRGEPTVMDVMADIEEVAVANGEENAIDVVSSTDGTWLGRSSLTLGLGSADGGDGGVVSVYSYDPDAPVRPSVMQILARKAPLVLDLDANDLNVIAVHPLSDEVSPALRLAVMPDDLRTLVIHREEIGVIEENGERIVVPTLPAEPLSIAFMWDKGARGADGVLPPARMLVGSLGAVDVYEWQGDALVRTGGLTLPAGATFYGMVSHLARSAAAGTAEADDKDVVLVTWRATAGFGGGFYDPAALVAGAAPTTPIAFPATLGNPTGVVDLDDGPAMLFARSALPGPALMTAAALRGEAPPLPGVADGPVITRATADGRFIIWLDEGAGDHMVRVLGYYHDFGLAPWAGYRLDARAAGPGNDPSGEWLYVPVPKLDMMSVVQ